MSKKTRNSARNDSGEQRRVARHRGTSHGARSTFFLRVMPIRMTQTNVSGLGEKDRDLVAADADSDRAKQGARAMTKALLLSHIQAASTSIQIKRPRMPGGKMQYLHEPSEKKTASRTKFVGCRDTCQPECPQARARAHTRSSLRLRGPQAPKTPQTPP